MRLERGQVLAFFAVALPVVLLPVAAYSVDAAVVALRAAGLQAATAEAAETAAQQLNIDAIRSGGGLALDTTAAKLVASKALTDEEPGAVVDTASVSGVDVKLVTSESLTMPFSLLSGPITLRARATARLVAGYDSPSSFLPLPSSTF
ncbi:MAG: hypothetical protein ABI334_00250 [Candidatus Dormiibacterota bacterium]